MFSKIVLPNNIRLVKIPKTTELTNLLVLIKAGSRCETDKNNGISHFLEHLMFKGTPKRPDTLALSKELDALGAEYNAFTAKDYTGYYIKAKSSQLPKMTELLFDMLNNSLLNEQELEKEKQVIIEEIKMYEDNPLMYIDNIFDQAVFSGNMLAKDISGTREIIKNMSRPTIVDYWRQGYSSPNIVLGLAGDDRMESQDIVTQYFSQYQNTTSGLPSFEQFIDKQTENRVKLYEKQTEQVQLALGFPAFSYEDPRLPALNVLSTILGGNMSSRLFISIRVQKGLAYFVRSSLDVYEDTGSFKIQAGVDNQRLNEALAAIIHEINLFKEKGVTEEELQRAKDYLEGILYLSLDDPSDLGLWYAKQELLLKKIKTPQERLAQIMKVTAAEVQQLAQDLMLPGKFNLALIGPFKDKTLFKNILPSK